MFTPEEPEALEHSQYAPIPGSDVEHVQGRQVAGSARHVADYDIGIAGNEPGQMPRHQTRAQVVSPPGPAPTITEMRGTFNGRGSLVYDSAADPVADFYKGKTTAVEIFHPKFPDEPETRHEQ